MKKNYPTIGCDYDSTYRAAEKALKKAAVKSGSPLLERVAHKEDPKLRARREEKSIMVRNVVDKCLSEYRDGEYTFKEAIEELVEALECL